MVRYLELTLTAQTAYAQLLEVAVSSLHSRTLADLPGSFAAKTVKGHKYWYYQYTEPAGKLRQAFVGPDNDAVRSLRAKKDRASLLPSLVPLARSAAVLGCAELLPRHLKVLARLAEYGFFRAGGVLVGTHAFLAYGNMLGVRWVDADRTQDIDFAHAGKSVALALPHDFHIDTVEAINSLEFGLLPVGELTGKAGATYLNPREPEFRLDFLTTLHRDGDKPFHHPQLGIALQPLKFMEFSLENVQQAALLSGGQCVIVNLPQPARFALHKLIVYGERQGTFATKSAKDLVQAAALLSCLKERRAWEVEDAWEDLLSRGKGWRTRVARGYAALASTAPELDLPDWLPLPA
ncbi:MAG: nucleotidyltransferase domain-containing protein [Gammaproteobacteria bacterium]|nr:nucleotidyltransferase domain-containing protein [Gammaproteobacteria bacterium]MBU1645788.1 nucleotidyltransferase domain-containing protein [Gammaproteobacteria bacterium]MBU1971296.1 nucleotidyltransferase domain-containing protein [Gammaproteobacteria bacterium]